MGGSYGIAWYGIRVNTLVPGWIMTERQLSKWVGEAELALIEEKPWTRRKEFLALNAAGTLPVLLSVPHAGRD